MKKHTKVLILAAGKGTRMKSTKPKVLHELGGKSMIAHILDNCNSSGLKDIYIVLGDQKDKVLATINHSKAKVIHQEKQLGTADAISSAKKHLGEFNGRLLILYGDMPLIKEETIKKIINNSNNSFSLVGFISQNPKGYGRIINKDEQIAVIEEKNASKEIKKVNLCYSGILCGPNKEIYKSLSKIKKDINTGEYLFTNIFKYLLESKKPIKILTYSEDELMGINDRQQLSYAEELLQKRIKLYHLKNGVTLLSPSSIYISSNVKIAKDVVLEPNVFLGNNVVLKANVRVKSNSYIEDSFINSFCEVGPTCRIRKNTQLGTSVKVGNFVEIKNSKIGNNTKINHLAYIGDTIIGTNTNVGAGTITCNYDGIRKNKTTIGDNVFIGSNCSLIAPIKIGNKSFIAAGSTISNNVDKNGFSIARAKQQIIKNGRSKFLKV